MPRWTPRQPRIDYSASDTMRELSAMILQMQSTANKQQHEKDIIELRSQEAIKQTSARLKEEDALITTRNLDIFKRQVSIDYPGAVVLKDGTLDLAGYDPTKAPSYKAGDAVALSSSLRDRGLSPGGLSFPEMQKVDLAYTAGKSKGMFIAGPSIDPSISALQGGDVTQGALTQSDLRDFED